MMHVQVIATIWIYVMDATSGCKARLEPKADKRGGRHRNLSTTGTPLERRAPVGNWQPVTS